MTAGRLTVSGGAKVLFFNRRTLAPMLERAATLLEQESEPYTQLYC